MINSIGYLLKISCRDYFIQSLDAEILLGFVLDWPRVKIKISHEQLLDIAVVDKFWSLVQLRAQGMPLAYILGYKDFWSFRLKVNNQVLIPRADTEILVETALAYLSVDCAVNILDLGTGSGAIALALAQERSHAHITGVDFSLSAVNLAKSNAALLQLSNVEFKQSNWFGNVRGEFAMIVANPPYIAINSPMLEKHVADYEPHNALYAGVDGLASIKQILSAIAPYLQPQGYFIVEHGCDQELAVRALLQTSGFIDVLTVSDLAGHPRVSLGVKDHRKATDIIAL